MARKYKRPPVAEVACEFRFEPGEPWDMIMPALIYDKLREEFPEREPVKQIATSVSGDEGGAQPHLAVMRRMRFKREDGKAIVEIGANYLLASHLRPYPGWEKFLPLVERVFSTYKEVTSPKGLRRVGLRYVNKVEFQEERVKLEDYFDFYPFVGDGLPQDHGPFICGIQIPFEDDRDILRLQMESAAPDQPGNVTAILLDLDYFLARARGIGLPDVFEWLKKAHAHVVETFEGCIKDSLRERFDEVK